MEKDKIEELRQGVGAMAEMSLIFFRAVLGSGASMEEALRLTQAFVSAQIYGKPQNGKESQEE